jgi:hemolysin D
MPIPSHNSSSAVTKQEAEEYKTYTQPQDDAEATQVEKHKDTGSEVNDWHYGTEELLDALPRPWTRSLLYTMVGMFLVLLPWSVLSRIDETGSARGRVEPKGATQKLDSPVPGRVIAVNVEEGETVKAGQVLMELESDVLKSELDQIQKKLEGLRNRQSNLDMLKNQLTLALQTQKQQNQAQELTKLSQVEQARQNLNALKTLYNVQKEEKLAQVNQSQQALESIKASYKLAKVRLQAAQEKVPRYQKAFEDGVLSKDRFKEVEQIAQESTELLAQAKSQIAQAVSSLQEQQSSYERTIHQAQSEIQQAELRLQEEERSYQSLIHTGKLAELKNTEQLKDLQTQINTLQSEIAQTGSQITSLKIQLQQRVVRSPIDGVIFELPISKSGAVVQPGERVAQIAPKKADLVLKAQMPNEQSGFLKVGMPVKVKFDAYPFQEYGIMPGKVNWISPDSKVTQTPQGNLESYELEIALEQQYINNGDKLIPLIPGQTATAEVIIRQRRVIDLVLDPFKKLQKGGLDI